MLAGRDRIVDNVKTLAFFRHLASPDSRVIDYPDGHHTLEFEPDPTRYALDLAAWLDRHARANVDGPPRCHYPDGETASLRPPWRDDAMSEPNKREVRQEKRALEARRR